MSSSTSGGIVSAWYRKARWLWCLAPLSVVFWLVSGLRRFSFKVGLLTSTQAPVPVVVVGNITVGGSGKSPLVSYLVNSFREQGFKPGVVSRGYGAQPAIESPVLVNERSTARQVGDEPLMLFGQLACPVCVCPDRSAAVSTLVAQGCDIVISDDGLQHYAMARDIEICVFDSQRLWGNGLMLPAGPLRESLARLSSVDYVILNGDPETDKALAEQIGARMRKGEADEALQGSPAQDSTSYPVSVMALRPTLLQRLNASSDKNQRQRKGNSKGGSALQAPSNEHVPMAVSEDTLPLASLQGKPVTAVAGIGHPSRFFSVLESAGAEVKAIPFEDHHAFQAIDFEGFKNDMVVMTEKDAVKCSNIALDNAWYLPVTAQLSNNLGQDIVERLTRAGRLKKQVD